MSAGGSGTSGVGRTASERRSSAVTAVLLAAGLVAGLVVSRLAGGDALWLSGVAALLAAALLLPIPVPWGGSVPTGYALCVALPALLVPIDAVVATGTGLALALAVTAVRDGARPALAAAARLAPTLASSLAAGAVLQATLGDPEVLLVVPVTASVLVAVDVALTRRNVAGDAEVELRSAWPVYLTIACGGALVALATEEFGVAMAAVGAFPLLITRFSFSRYASTAAGYRQTISALGLVPELAGLTPLGHSERSAFYADALACQLRLERRARERIITAARLHHLGAVPSDATVEAASPPPDPAALAATGASILAQAGFGRKVCALVRAAPMSPLDEPAASLEAAVVRVASHLDTVIGSDAALVDEGVADVASSVIDRQSRRVAAALLELVGRRPTLMAEAVAAGNRFSEAAEGVDLSSVLAPAPIAEILPFPRRRSS